MKSKLLQKVSLKKKTDQIDSLDFLLSTELTNFLQKVMVNYSFLLQQYDVERLHQMRVNLRRINSLLGFFKNELPKQEWGDINEIIKSLIKPTAKIRDHDVVNSDFIAPAFRENDTSFEFRRLLDHSNGHLLYLHNQLSEEFSSFRYRKLIKKLEAWINNHQWQHNLPVERIVEGDAFHALIQKRLNQRMKQVNKKLKNVTKNNRKALHQLRMDVKELRYVLDILRYSLKQRKAQLNYLQELQELLGCINDTYVAEHIVDEFNAAKYSDQSKIYIHTKSKHQRKRRLKELKRKI